MTSKLAAPKLASSLLGALLLATLARTAGGVAEKHFEQRLTVFSPQGRLYQVEYAQVAAQTTGELTVAVRGRRACVVAARRRDLGRLVAPESVLQVHRVSHGVGCAVSGVPGDELELAAALRGLAVAHRGRLGHEAPAPVLALRLADRAQVSTQAAAVRPLGAACLVLGSENHGAVDGERPVLFRVDPTGQFYICKVWASKFVF